jgi:superfamily II DNA or RNA helicase
MILVHRQELVDQTSRTLTAFDVPHGVIAAGRTSDGSELIQVASVQTLIRRIDRVMDPDLIVIDEAHHAIAGSWRRVVERFDAARVLGVTATPERLDGKGLRDVFSDLVRGPEVRDLVRDGHLSAPVYYAPPQHIDMASVQLRRGDYDQKGLESVMDAPKITGDAVDHYRRICAGKPAVVFCVSITHAEHVAEEFRRAGFRAATIDGTLSPEDRRDRVRSLGNGRLQVLTSCEIINEGFDLPIVSVGILLRPTQSLGLHLQQIGRVLRPAPGKDRAVILDHAGNLARHGLAEDVRDWSLDGAEKRKKKAKAEDTIKTRQCPKCFACHPWSPSCPECGNEYVTDGRQIEVVGGDLVALDTRFQQCPGCQHVHSRWDASCPKCGMVHDAVRARKKEQGRAQTLDELVELGKRRGYANPYGWARHTWNARQGSK